MIKKLLPVLICIPLMYSCSNKNKEDIIKAAKEKAKKEEVEESTDITKEELDEVPVSYADLYITCCDLDEDAEVRFTDYKGREYIVPTVSIFIAYDEDTSLLIKTVRKAVDGIVAYTRSTLPNGLTSRPEDNEPFIYILNDDEYLRFRVNYTYKNDYGVTKRALVNYYTDRDGNEFEGGHHVVYL